MPIKTFKMGPGTLKLGVAGATDASAQITNARVEWDESVTSTDAVPVLDGQELAGEDEATYAATLAGNVVQDIDAAGLVAWSWTNKGQVVDFEFVPNTVEGRAVTGQVRVVPITLGGDVKQRPRSDISWSCIGDPELGAAGA